MADGQVRENEVAGWAWAIQIGHASHGGPSEDWEAGSGRRRTARGNSSGILQGCCRLSARNDTSESRNVPKRKKLALYAKVISVLFGPSPS
jgi:hypothetical protein